MQKADWIVSSHTKHICIRVFFRLQPDWWQMMQWQEGACPSHLGKHLLLSILCNNFLSYGGNAKVQYSILLLYGKLLGSSGFCVDVSVSLSVLFKLLTLRALSALRIPKHSYSLYVFTNDKLHLLNLNCFLFLLIFLFQLRQSQSYCTDTGCPQECMSSKRKNNNNNKITMSCRRIAAL